MGKASKALRILAVASILVVLVLVLPSGVFAMPASRTYESYTTGADADYEVYGSLWYAQTFNVTGESHSVLQLRILAYREGLPSTITMSVRAVDESGLPVGADLTSGTFDGDTMTNSTAGAWYGVDVTEESLDYGKQYAIIIRAEAGDASNSIHIRYDGTAGTYAGGSEMTSSNGGISWTADTDDDVLFEVHGAPLLEISQVSVFRGYVEDNDMLFTILYYNTYTPYYPLMDSRAHFWLQLRSPNGTAVIAQTTCNDWGYKPGAIYLSADSAAGLDDGGAYRVYIYGTSTETPSSYYTLKSADWRGTDITLLDTWILNTARDMANYYLTDMTTYTPSGEKLNDEGSVIFALGVPGLQYVRPNMFQTIVYSPQYSPQEWTNAYEGSAVWSDVIGSSGSEALTAAGDLVGANPRDIGGLLVVAGYIVVVLIILGTGGSAAGAGLMAVPFILGGVWLHLLNIALVSTIAAIGIILFVQRLFWGRA